MRHIIIRSILAVVWAAGAVASAVSGNMPMSVLYLLLCGLCLITAYSMWKKGKK